MLSAKRKDLERAFRKHLHVFRSVGEPHINLSYKLLLFYAVECGLKVLILKEIYGNTTEDIQNHSALGYRLKGANGHDLKILLQFLNYPSYKLQELILNNKLTASVKEYNQVWRYGIETESERESEVIVELKKIADWIEGGL